MEDNKNLKVVADVYSPSKEEYTAMSVGEPQNMLEVRALANFLCRSKFIPQSFRGDLNTAVMLIVTCKQYGLPITALSEVMEVNGKVGFWGRTKLGIVLKSPLCDYIIPTEQTDKKCTVETQRKGWPKPVSITYTLEQAEKAGLTARSDAWKKHPADMLYWRAVSRIISQVYPDVIQGFATVEDEEENTISIIEPKEVAKPKAKKVKAEKVVIDAEPVVNEVPQPEPIAEEMPIVEQVEAPKEEVIAEPKPIDTAKKTFRFVKRVLLLGGKRTLVGVNPLTEEEDQWTIGSAEVASEMKKRTGMKISFVPEGNTIHSFEDEQ